jgi:hypothetical protein
MKAQVAFSKSKGIISNLIKLWTIGSYSHVELVIDGMSYTAGVSILIILVNKPQELR